LCIGEISTRKVKDDDGHFHRADGDDFQRYDDEEIADDEKKQQQQQQKSDDGEQREE
jgi:hypothetical protein